MLKNLLSNLSIGMSTFIFDTSGPLLFVHPIKKIKTRKNKVLIFIEMIKRQWLLYVVYEDNGKKILTSLVTGVVNLHL